MKALVYLICITGITVILAGCDSPFLDAKPQKSLLVPSTLADVEALLNNSRDIMNVTGYVTLIADGDFRIDENILPYMDQPTRINYTWSEEETTWIGDWDYAYRQVFYANVALQTLSQLKDEDTVPSVNELKGRALFYRAWALHLLTQQFAPVYSKQTASALPGIPYPLSPNVDNKTVRVSLQQTYDFIFTDLLEALDLLPQNSQYITQPSKVSVYGLLARLYLITEDYENALLHANNVLKTKSDLLDFNHFGKDLYITFPSPFQTPNPEILYYTIGNTTVTGSSFTYVDSDLYQSYESNDLRKSLFYSPGINYKGSYTGNPMPFMGLATDEMYLIKAECEVRKSSISEALKTLNYFLARRYEIDSFEDIVLTDLDKLLQIILAERRKELIGRGTTWIDLRRLNKVPLYARTLKRVINGEEFTLEPNSNRYVMKIPMDEILNSGIDQNP